MSSLKKKALLVLMAMIVLVLIPMSFAADVDNSDVASVADDVDQVSDIDADELGSTPVPDDGAFVYMQTDSATIDDGQSVTISGQVRYAYGAGGSDVLNEGTFPVTCTYTDVNGDVQSYSASAKSGKFTFDTATFEGLAGRDNPYSLTISATDDGTAAGITGSSNIKSATYTLTITPTVVEPTTAGADVIAAKLDGISEGAVVDLSDYDIYDVEDASFAITVPNVVIKGNGNTIIKGHGAGNGIFDVSASGVTFMGIKFIDTNPNSVMTYYDDATKNANEIKGWGIRFFRAAASNGVVDNCSFINFNHGVRIQGGADDVTVKNSYFTGITNYLRNDPTVNVEKGTKAIGIMGSKRPQIINNTFEGPMLDAISMASNSADGYIFNNTFIGNAYAIYFGGASTGGTTIKGNRFINVGYYKELDNLGNYVEWDKLPIISIQKAADTIEISDNEITAVNNNIFVAAEAGNEAHGYPSAIGDVKVTGNTINIPADVAAQSVVLLHILSRGGEINPTDDINVSGNTLNGAKPLIYWNTNWGAEDGDAVIPKGSLAPTIIKIVDVYGLVLTCQLTDINGAALTGETVTYKIGDGDAQSVETDENGIFSFSAESGKNVNITFAETDKLAASEASVFLTSSSDTLIGSALTVKDLTAKAGDGANLEITLVSAMGDAIANKTVSVIIDGVAQNVTTGADGVAKLSVKYASAGTHFVTVSFAGDDAFASSIGTGKITVNKKATTLTAKKATLKVKKAKKVKVTLKSEGKALAKKTVTIKVNGKTFKAKTNAKGVATIKVKVTKKGKMTATVNFAGDGAYKSVTKKVKFTVKK